MYNRTNTNKMKKPLKHVPAFQLFLVNLFATETLCECANYDILRNNCLNCILWQGHWDWMENDNF